MNGEDRFLERLRGDASSLQYSVDDASYARLAARVASRIEEVHADTPFDFIAAWLRPLVAAMVVILLLSSVAVSVLSNRSSGEITSLAQSTSSGSEELFRAFN